MPPATAQSMPPQTKEKDVPREVQPSATSADSQMASTTNDPNSIGNLMKQTEVMNGQATANSLYDPPVPPPQNSGFVDAGFVEGNDMINIITVILICVGILLIIGIFWNMNRSSSGRCAFSLPFKMPRLFRK
jgi:hypothetical protein